MGGYQTKNNKKTRWGMIYRDTLIDSINIGELKYMGIRTIINMKKNLAGQTDTTLSTSM